MLLVAAVAVWTSYAVDRNRIATLERRIARDRPLVRELVVEDPRRLAAVKRETTWLGENRWEFYLPEGGHRLCLATREIPQAGLAAEGASLPLRPGRHVVVLETVDGAPLQRVVATLDGRHRLELEKPHAMGYGSESPADQVPSAPPDVPLVLHRLRYNQPLGQGRSGTPPGPTDGILLWIEPEPTPLPSDP
ncbi:hypothetical protein ElP_30550 [Tautonia plasticadhaerens]|uniref:Uncharacterized protein n=1 Tax=Tautonia plasticadhaerens TaxID=2527974 RepID=A0A518H2S4_9BACT|nr:hypothetical protein ElP_30550 [Tautonia plasticadhaerens]